MASCLSEELGVWIGSARAESDLRQFGVDARADDSFLSQRKPSQDGV